MVFQIDNKVSKSSLINQENYSKSDLSDSFLTVDDVNDNKDNKIGSASSSISDTDSTNDISEEIEICDLNQYYKKTTQIEKSHINDIYEFPSTSINDKNYDPDCDPLIVHQFENNKNIFAKIGGNDKKHDPVNILQNIKINNATELDQPKLHNRKKEVIKLKARLVRCVFCEEDTVSKNFMRHLKRKHCNETEVRTILNEPLNSKGRKLAMAKLRKQSHFENYLDGDTRPENNDLYYPCTNCKGLYKKSYLRRHIKVCDAHYKNKNFNAVSNAQTFAACALDQTNTISRLNVKEKVFNIMRGDDIAFVAKKDLLISHFGNSYLKKHRKEKSIYTCSNKMREFARLLIECRKLLNNSNIDMQNVLHPSYFDTIVTAARNLAGYDASKKYFIAPSLALHFGTNLNSLCDELYHLVIKETIGFRRSSASNKKYYLKDIKNMKHLIVSRWNIEMASLANKDLQEKKWNKPLLIPLVSDVKLFKEEAYRIAEKSITMFKNGSDTIDNYKNLVQCVLSLLIIFNRKRIGDVQYMKISDYKNDQRSNFQDFEDALSATEKVLATRYRRVLNSGKGSRAVVVLIPENIDKYI